VIVLFIVLLFVSGMVAAWAGDPLPSWRYYVFAASQIVATSCILKIGSLAGWWVGLDGR
jgi:hypothetical protein